jgi:hypothetical protein
MIGRMLLVMAMMVAGTALARAQDVPGIEICTVEKTMERRTSCLQSNIDFLKKTIDKLRFEQQQRLDVAKLQINMLAAAFAELQKKFDEAQSQKAAAAPASAPDTEMPASGKDTTAKPASDNDPAAKPTAPAAKDAK